MLREFFIGRKPSHFKINYIVKAFIISDTLMWSAQNLFAPIFAVFVIKDISNGSIEVAAISYSAFLIARVALEPISGNILTNSNDVKKFIAIITGFIILSTSYLGFAVTNTLWGLYAAYILAGIGLGIAGPAKNALFSTHLDQNKEATEWGLYDGIHIGGMALAGALGGFIAQKYGFTVLFLISSFLTILSIIPYIMCIRRQKNAFTQLFLNRKKIKIFMHSHNP